MIRNRKIFFTLSVLFLLIIFLTSCSSLPLIGKKEEKKTEKLPEGKTVRVEGMETVKGTNPPRTDTPEPVRKPSSEPVPRREPETRMTSAPTRPFAAAPLPFLQMGFKKKVAILDFENKTTYQEEKIGEAVARRLSDKLEATQRVVIMDKVVVSEMLSREGVKFESLIELPVMKQAHRSLGIQAFALGAVTDVSILSSKASDTSDEEVSFATAKVEIRLIDASTGNLLKTFIGRSPIFGTKETGEYSKSKAVMKAIDFGLEDILDGFFRQLDYLDWTTTIAKIEGESLFINAGRLSGLRIGDTLEIYEPGKEIIHPATKISLGWTTGQLKGIIRVSELFGVDAAIGKVAQGSGFNPNDVVKTTAR
ncbi:MAG: hypothetical protein FJ115_14505 [Deltaproteobacteria bacterium]|nr:hypothetical protein [Deltaproteobacteria bacterium]MBM4324769.1 hypothetical protein [Deltaproteobacteria bacterium]MBM4347903.1 hypothetical protein [Deltaproteobacteria bacterium]